MPAGPGAVDVNGVRRFGEADAGTMSDVLNLGMDSVSGQFVADRIRLAALELAAPHEGLTRIIPTSVVGTGVAIAAGGKVTLGNALTAFSVNLPSTYENILVKIKAKCSVAGTKVGVRFRTGVTDLVGTGYVRNGSTQLMAGSETRDSSGGDSLAWIGLAGTGFSALEASINGLFLADATTLYTPNLIDDAGTKFNYVARNATATAHSGLTFLTNTAATISVGTVLRFYGFNNN